MEIKEDIAIETKKYKKIGLFKKPKNRLLSLLDLKHSEEVLINLRLFPFRSIFKNDIKERYAKRLVLTTERIIIVIKRNWILKYSLPYYEVTDIFITKEWYISGDFPVINIKTANDTYKILFTTLFPYRKKIQAIVDCIKKRNPKINVEIDSKYTENFRREILFTKIKFK